MQESSKAKVRADYDRLAERLGVARMSDDVFDYEFSLLLNNPHWPEQVWQDTYNAVWETWTKDGFPPFGEFNERRIRLEMSRAFERFSGKSEEEVAF